MKTLLLVVPLALAGPLAAVAQEPASSPWVETRFHRVHLRNGNFIDGHLVQQNAKGVVLQMNRSGDFAVRKDLIQRVEYIKMRSLKEVPKVPTVESTPEIPEPDATAKGTGSKTPRPETVKLPSPAATTDAFRPETMKAVDSMLTTYALARSDMRRELAPQLRALGSEAVAYACWIARTGRPGVEMPALIEALFQLDSPEVMPTLLHVAASGVDSFDRAAALKCLARKSTPEARAALYRGLGDASGQVWRVAQEEVLKLHEKGEADIEAILPLLQARSDKGAVAQMLGKMGGDAALGALHDLLDKGTPADKVAAMRAMGAAGRAEDGDLARDLLDESDTNLRREACLFLGKIKHGASVRKLIDALKDDDAPTAQSAFWALKEITALNFPQNPQRWEDWWVQTGQAKYGAEK